MRFPSKLPLFLFLLTTATLNAAADYTSFLTPERGFTEVTDMDQIIGGPDYCYILCAAEDPALIVGVGTYEAKPDWAGDDTKALRYDSAATDPVLNLSNFFTIEKNDHFIGLKNVFYNSHFFQTHENAGFMYVLTYTEPTLSEWCYLQPTFNDGYWLFESGKYPVASNDWACGYLGPWNLKVAQGEALALNRRNTDDDPAGHFRMFRIRRKDLQLAWSQRWKEASVINKMEMSWLICNPSFETGDERGWTLVGKDANGNEEFRAHSDYPMTEQDGTYLLNAYQWWAQTLGATQTVENIPCGKYELSAVVATWEGRTVTFSANDKSITKKGGGDDKGIKVSLNVDIGPEGKLTIGAQSTAQWWEEGHESETQTFFKLDHVQLKCRSMFIQALAVPLPNDGSTTLLPEQWYYYDAPLFADYSLQGRISDIVYTTNGQVTQLGATTKATRAKMTFEPGRLFFKTEAGDATLSIQPLQGPTTGLFTVTALNVDGLPNSIAGINLNPDGPGSDGTKKISRYLASKSYDLIGCSEDFNYHGSLMSALLDDYSSGTVRSTLSVGNLPLGQLFQGSFRFDTDGLNIIWKNDALQISNESWTPWESMVSVEGNQYVKKGYRHYDLTIGQEGQVIDVFVLHMDAGSTEATASREAQWRQLATAVNQTDALRPKLIIGDTNSRWTREDIKTHFKDLLYRDLTMSDVWVEFYRSGIYPTTAMDDLTDQSEPLNYARYEIVDKIIYINPTAQGTLRLQPYRFKIEQDYTYGYVDGTEDTTPLGDHRPVVVTFRYNVAEDVEDAITGPSSDAQPHASSAAYLYDLSGRRLSTSASRGTTSALPKGLYIMQGKKVMVK
ncbi:MAG: hypothetical protein K6A32_07345 [Bacteroidales bacterium]|nr:hypothetical protein [Bacteroidales bacterium]